MDEVDVGWPATVSAFATPLLNRVVPVDDAETEGGRRLEEAVRDPPTVGGKADETKFGKGEAAVGTPPTDVWTKLGGCGGCEAVEGRLGRALVVGGTADAPIDSTAAGTLDGLVDKLAMPGINCPMDLMAVAFEMASAVLVDGNPARLSCKLFNWRSNDVGGMSVSSICRFLQSTSISNFKFNLSSAN